MAILCSCIVQAQNRNVSGRVTSQEDGEPLPGVNVVVRGSVVGTVTDADGRFSLSVPSSEAVLVFSFVGLQSKEILVGEQTVINVQLGMDATQLGEVVVTALGIERSKNELPFAAQEVRSDEVTRTRQTNFVSALSGKVAGLDIKTANTMGGSTNVVIRGYKSITNNNQALFVIDGVPVSNANTNTDAQKRGAGGPDYGNAAADINPENIASINVLKGAAATALYGSRASNGVIVITTKRGRKNSMEVTVNSGLTWGQIDKSTFARYQKEYGQGYVPTFPSQETLDDGTRPVVRFQSDASYGPRFDPNLLVYQWDAFDPKHENYRKATPWVVAENDPSTFYETAVTSNQNINVSGGNDKVIFKMSYTRTDEKGVLPNSTLDKDMFSFATTYDFSDRFSITANVNYSHIEGLGRYGTGYSGLNPNQQFRQWWATNVDIKDQREAYFRDRQNITWNWNAARTGPIYMDNPYWTRYENYSNDSRDNYFGYASANYKFTDWLEVAGRIAINSTHDFQEQRVAVGSAGLPSYGRYERSFRETNYDLFLNINRKLTDDINLKGVVGTNIRRSEMNAIRAQTTGGLAVPGLYSLSNSKNPLVPPVEDSERVGVDGIFASATLSFRDFIFVDLAARRDQSTTLPKDNNAYLYPSAAVSFVFSQFLDLPWLSHAKVRANIAQVGNDAPPLSVYDVYDKPTAIGSVPMFSLPNTKRNPELKPEMTNSIEVGMDADFFEGRIGFDVTWYKTNTVDQIIPVTTTGASGFTSRFVNAGEVENKGFEISAFVVPVSTPTFSWTLNVNWSRNRNLVKSLYGEGEGKVMNIPIMQGQGGVSLNAAVGYPYGVIRGTDFVYTNGQKTVNSQGYYLATSSSAEIIGDPNPDWLGGVSNTFKYKNISINFLVDMRYGGDIFSLDQWYGDGSGLYEETAGLNDLGNPKRSPVSEGGGVLFPGVKADGTPNDIRAEHINGDGLTAYGYVANGQRGMPRAAYIYDGSFLKLRELALTYSLPADLISKLGPLKAIDISIIGRNLWIIHKNLKYADPEESLSSGNANSGYQSGAYPAVRSYGFNARFTF
jgi:TonB-linked outer membrane protein, SusC/RagA family